MVARQGSLGIQRLDSIDLFVHDLERSRAHFLNNLDFAETSVSAPAFEARHNARASVVQAGESRLVLIAPLGPEGECADWLERHPDGVARLVFEVADAPAAFAALRARGATLITGLELTAVENGILMWFDIATAMGDTVFRFVQRDLPANDERASLWPGLRRTNTSAGGTNCFGITHIDHITANYLTLQPALAWMEQVMGFERYWEVEFHTRGAAGGSGLKSVVMWDPRSGLKFAANEPARPCFKDSQIYQFYQHHRGAGVQHVALAVSDLIDAVDGLRRRGVAFMPTPGAYYESLPRRLAESGVRRIDENVDDLRRLEILVDGETDRKYLLQIFMKEAAAMFADPEAGPFFIELLQRKGDAGFGGGNFRALFESIERQQQLGDSREGRPVWAALQDS